MQEKKRENKIPRIGSKYKVKNQFFFLLKFINQQKMPKYIRTNSTAQQTAHAQFY